MRRYRGAWASTLLLLLMALAPQGSADVTVISTSIDPTEPTPDDFITFYVEVANTSNISKVYLVYCSLDPFLCHQPEVMNYTGLGVYSVKVMKKFEEGEWKYNVTFQLKDGNTTFTNDTHFLVKKPAIPNGNGNGNNTTNGTDGNETDDGGGGLPMQTIIIVAAAAVVAVVAAVVAAVLLRRRKQA